MEQVGAKRIEISGVGEKRQITAVLCGSLSGDYLPMQLIYQGKTDRCHPVFKFPLDCHVTHSPKHWSTEVTMLAYVRIVIIFSIKLQGISNPPCCKSDEYLLLPITIHTIEPPLLKNRGQIFDIFSGKWPIMLPSFTTATSYQSCWSLGSLVHSTSSPTVALHMSL